MSAEESAAEEGIFGKIGDKEEIAFEDQVGLRKEGKKDVLQEECVIVIVGFFLQGEWVVIIVGLFQREGSCQDARDRREAGRSRKDQR